MNILFIHRISCSNRSHYESCFEQISMTKFPHWCEFVCTLTSDHKKSSNLPIASNYSIEAIAGYHIAQNGEGARICICIDNPQTRKNLWTIPPRLSITKTHLLSKNSKRSWLSFICHEPNKEQSPIVSEVSFETEASGINSHSFPPFGYSNLHKFHCI